MKLDHLAICSKTLDEGVIWAEERLGVQFQSGGSHAVYGTHNKLLGLEDGLYLEVICVDLNATGYASPRWFDLDNFEGPPRLANWICRVDDMSAAIQTLPECGDVVALTRGALSWDITVPSDGRLPFGGALPTLIEWHSPNLPGESLINSGVKLLKLEVVHPLAQDLSQRIAVEGVTFTADSEFALHATFQTPMGEITL